MKIKMSVNEEFITFSGKAIIKIVLPNRIYNHLLSVKWKIIRTTYMCIAYI